MKTLNPVYFLVYDDESFLSALSASQMKSEFFPTKAKAIASAEKCVQYQVATVTFEEALGVKKKTRKK